MVCLHIYVVQDRIFNESNEIVMGMPIENGLSEGFKGYHNNYLNYVRLRTVLNDG